MADDSPDVILVEDDPLQIKSFRYAAETYDLRCHVHTASNGLEALEMLRTERVSARRTIVLTDLRLPGMGGLEFIEQVRADPELRRLVVFVVSSTDDVETVRRAYELGIAGFVRKSSLAPDRRYLIQLLRDYTRLVALPRR